jgi:hypothetical protein
MNEVEWIDEELKKLEDNALKGPVLPALKLDENKAYEISIDFSKNFDEWKDPQTNTVKKIIPVIHEGVRKNFWLNTKNPLYKQLIEAGKAGKKHFKIVRIGQAKATKYSLIE